MVVHVPYPPSRDSYPLIRSSVVKIVCVHLAFGFGYKQFSAAHRASYTKRKEIEDSMCPPRLRLRIQYTSTPTPSFASYSSTT